MGILFIISLSFGFIVLVYSMNVVVSWVMMTLNSMDFEVIIVLDYISVLFCCVIFMISGVVFYYSESYMNEDKLKNRFYYLVFMFVVSMLMVILSPNFVSILLGWDGLGLVSYCLIIYYQNSSSYAAGMMTIMMNRVGDVGILMVIGGLMGYGGWTMYYLWEEYNWWVSACVLLAAMTKSAQMPFSAWLPAAMAAPTPVSALVHSSTLVTAGVYLLIRFYDVIFDVKGLQNLMLFVGLGTMMMAGASAIYECDLKSIIALSTLSQLGLMVGVLSLGQVELAYFHLLTHAMFSALLFLGAGKIIHVMEGNQDVRLMGGLLKTLPLSIICMSISSLALCGFPFLTGFYSKDLILDQVWNGGVGMVGMSFLMVGTLFTCMYTVRLGKMLVGEKYKGNVIVSVEDNEVGYTSPMLILLVGTMFGGCMLMWLLFSSPVLEGSYESMKVTPLVILILGFMGGAIICWEQLGDFYENSMIGKFMSGLGGMIYLSGNWIVFSPLMIGEMLDKLLDKGWGELFGGQGFYNISGTINKSFHMWQINTVKIYLLVGGSWVMLLFYI
uniref:NADH dehydrogenase subunit 5 n=1 Tax=Litostrophus scaber TaxID=2259356 RepID=UPI00286CC375|nr:NADH dehydrogenase subunit 5 [Litostrophus scaber]WKF19543.1 NADH dehydrogenase subunit 5 [Litostrophus scaber]